MTSINLLCQHIKFVIWYRLVFPIRCISRTANYNKNMMFPLLSYTYENISFRSHHVRSFSHAFCTYVIIITMLVPALFAIAFFAGQTAAHFLRRPSGHTVSAPVIACGSLPPAFDSGSIPVSADGNWGLGFPSPGQTPVGNASADDEKGCRDMVFFQCFQNGRCAAVFVVGNYLETSPELVKQMIAEGHTVANHTYHHPDMSRISDKAAFEKELTALETLYQSVTGQTMKKYYRPPQGKYSESNLQMAKELGYKTFFWSLAYVDWMQDQQPSKKEAFSKLLTRIHPGAIVLLHSTSQTNAQILDELLAKWEEMGYQFGQLDEL